MANFPDIEYQLGYIRKGANEIIPEKELREKLEHARTTGVPLRMKMGLDPTAPDLHLGHTVLIRKLKHFQDMGHTAIFLIGDGTAMIGDPTGRLATRPAALPGTNRPQRGDLQGPGVQDHGRKQDRGPPQQRMAVPVALRGHDPLGGQVHGFANAGARGLSTNVSRKKKPISVHELLYPMAQGYDSVMLNADVELGGTDQKFNLLVGRELQRIWGQAPQVGADHAAARRP